MIKMLQLIADESLFEKESDLVIGYYDIHELADSLNIPCPKTKDLMTVLHTKGYLCSKTHFRPHSIKTNAKVSVITDIMEKIVHKS
jgi:tRNA G26 N,N-dimethylase Trm1